MERASLEKLIIMMLAEKELSGYDIYKQMSTKGLKTHSNYLYTVLTGMHAEELLNARWVHGSNGPRKRLYTLSKKGAERFRLMMGESVDLLMHAFKHVNSGVRDLTEHSDSVKAMFDLLGMRYPGRGARFVLAAPSFDPLLCYPIAFDAIGEAFSGASVVVVKPPGVILQPHRANLTFVDGQRHDLPLKDGFADYLMLEGFPRDASMEDTVQECLRVLTDDGNLLIRHPMVMTEEKRPTFSTFGEFASRLYFDFSQQDRTVNMAEVTNLLQRNCSDVSQAERNGNALIFARGKARFRPSVTRKAGRILSEEIR